MKKTLFIKNAAILTATSIILRIFGIIFKVWLAGVIGSEGIGLYHLVFSVYILASAFATAGIPTAVTRLISDRLAKNNIFGVIKVIKRAAALCLAFSAVSFLVVYFAADFISISLLNDIRALPSLKFMCFSLPFMGFSAVLKSYFFARRNVTVNSVAVLLEQIVRIALCLFFVNKFSGGGIATACFAVIVADTLSEIFSCLFMTFFFIKDRKNLVLGTKNNSSGETKELLRISSPILLSRYSTSFLRTAESILVPKTLSKTLSYSSSLACFGAIKGMALPVLFFPSSVLNALSALLLPEMSEAVAKNKPYVIKNAVRKTVRTTWLLGVIFGAVFFFCGNFVGELLYNDNISGHLISLLAPLVPLMYLDSICDGILKGLDQQFFTFKTALCDSCLRLLLIGVFVPKYSLTAFLAIMYFSNIFTSFLHVGRLLKLTGLKINLLKDIISPLFAAATICFICKNVLSFFGTGLVFTAVFALFSIVLFLLFIISFKIIDPHDYI